MAELSVFIIARNEAARLPRTLDAVKAVADDLVLVDSGSDDDTVELARARGARVFTRDWTGYGPQKRYAEDQCLHPWRLNIDADEEVTPALAEEIRTVLRRAEPGAWTVRILDCYPGEDGPRPFAADYEVVRLYHASVGRYRDHPLFDRVEVDGPVSRLRAPIHHHPFLSWDGLVAKLNALSTYQAETARPKARWLLRLRLVTEGPVVFLKSWIWRRHVLGGWKGFVFSGVTAFSRWLRIAKMLER